MRKPVAFSVALLLVAFLTACSPRATQPGGSVVPGLPVLSAASFTSGEAFEALPPGDMLMTIDAGTLINTTIPTALANSPDERTKFDQSLKEMQEKAGIDPKELKLVAITFTFPKGSGGKPQFAGVMTGSFDTAKLTESLKKDPKTGVANQSEDYNGQTLYIKKDGGDEVAAAVLDSSTLVMGSPTSMARQAIDAHAKKADNATKDVELFNAFKATKQSGLLRFAMRFPKDQIPPDQAAKDPTTKSFLAINYLTGALDASAGIGLDLTAKTSSPADAQPLHDNLQKLLDQTKKSLAGNDQMKSLMSILNATTLTMNNADVTLNLVIPPDQLATLAADLQKSFGGAMGGSGAGGSHMNANSNENEDDDDDQ
jgi:hypothetical protein